MKKHLLLLLLFPILGFCQNTILWEIKSPSGEQTSYMLGTYHQMGNSFVDSLPIIKEKMLKSDLAIFESIEDDEIGFEIVNARQQSFELNKHFKKKELEYLKQIAKNWRIDLYKYQPTELLMKLQQVFYTTNCGNVKETDTWDHFDNYLINIAKQNNKPLMGFETISEQIEFIERDAKNPKWKQVQKPIKYWLKHLKNPNLVEDDDNCKFTNYYKNFALDYRFDHPCDPENVLVTERNNNWMKQLPNLLQTKNCFIAVGLLHLANNCGLLQQLKNQGFTITPVSM